MSEILCTYTLTESNTVGYFLIDSNVNYRQFINFIRDNLNMNDFIITTSNDIPITNDQELSQLYTTNECSIKISPSVNQPIEEESKKPEPEPIKQEEQPKEEEKQSTKFVIGDTTKSILERFGIQVDETEDPYVIVSKLPPPFQFMVRQHLANILANPERFESCAKRIAMMFNVPEEGLVSDARNFVEYMNAKSNENNDAPVEKQPEQPEQPQESDNVQSPNCPPQFPFGHFGHYGRFRGCPRFRPHFGMNPEQPKESNEEKPKDQVIHHATCDQCQKTIIDIRYKCLTCPDYDLCKVCEDVNAKDNFHSQSHVFAKIYKPWQARVIQHKINSAVPPPFPPVHGPRHGPRRGPRFVAEEEAGFEGRHHEHRRGHKVFPRIQALEETVKELQAQIESLKH